jgi:long-chain acyl-CoA synthetase
MAQDTDPFVAVTRFAVKGDTAEFEAAFTAHADFMRAQQGFLQAELVHSTTAPQVYVNVGRWADRSAYLAVLQSGEFRGHLGTFARLADVEPFQGEVLLALAPAAG